MSDTLKLTLRKEPFEEILNGTKKHEYREEKDWIEQRLYDKEWKERKYKFIGFINGYGADRPWMKVEYKGFDIIKKGESYKPGKMKEKVEIKTYAIKLGKILDIRNID